MYPRGGGGGGGGGGRLLRPGKVAEGAARDAPGLPPRPAGAGPGPRRRGARQGGGPAAGVRVRGAGGGHAADGARAPARGLQGRAGARSGSGVLAGARARRRGPRARGGDPQLARGGRVPRRAGGRPAAPAGERTEGRGRGPRDPHGRAARPAQAARAREREDHLAARGLRQGPVGVAARPKPGGAAGSGGGAAGKAKGKGAAGGGAKKGGSKGKSKGKNPRPPSNFDPHAAPPFALGGRYPLPGYPRAGAPEADMMPMFRDPALADFQDMLPGLENEMALTVGGSAMSTRDGFAFSGGSGLNGGGGGAGGRGSGAAARNGGSLSGKKRKASGGAPSRGRGLTKEAGQHPPPLAMKPGMPAGGLGGWGQAPPHPGGGLFSDVSDAKPSLGLSLKKTPSLLNLLGSPTKP